MADSISTIALDMTNGSSLVGAVNTDNTAKEVTVKLSKTPIGYSLATAM